MSHFTVMVIGDNPKKQLKPYDENIKMPEYISAAVSEEDKRTMIDYYVKEKGFKYLNNFADLYAKYGKDWNDGDWRQHTDGTWHEYSTYNTKAKWDWYEIGGRWAGFLKPKPNVKVKEPNFSWGWKEEDKQEVMNNADQVTKGEVDWKGMMFEGYNSAVKQWDKVLLELGQDAKGHINQPPLTWEKCRELHTDIKDVREAYNEQALVRLFNSLNLGFYASISDFDCTREEYGRRGANNSIATYAVVKDGEWISKGDMGWFGISSESEEEAKTWSDDFYTNFIEPLSDNTLITIVDCHI